MFLLVAGLVRSQPVNYSNFKKKKLAVSAERILIDSNSIVPRTFFIKNIDTSLYQLDEINATLSWKIKPKLDTVEVMYRVFPYKFNEPVHRFAYDSIRNNFIRAPFVFDRNNKKQTGNSLFDFGSMNYNGSFGRALSFGNSQDVVINSQFNLQLNGFIGDSIEVAAAITDNNIPIQPDGSTQQLNEFDRVWLQFKKNGWEVNLGDIDIRQNQYSFLNFYKRLQGVSYGNNSSIGKNISNNLLVSGAIAKGKFTRNIFQGQEGNQGPYRLKGANKETFFIILAGTERVFIDGILMQRGDDQDYVINYNTAEITFTPRQMITKDRRIQVEFEYADRNYLNSFLFVTDEVNINNKLKVAVSAYNNADAKNSPINQSLDQKQRQFLSAIGDSTQYAFYPTASLDTFSTGKILYAKKDTAYAGGHDSIYVFSNQKENARYSLGFIDVGPNRGNYVPDFNGANGKVYKWVKPVNGIPQGNYEPATFLVTPKKQQLVNVASEYRINDKTTVQAEVAMSNFDVNSFSSLNKGDDKGYAAKIYLNKTNDWHAGKKRYALKTTLGYEWVESKFKPLERLRAVEFYRDWGMLLIPADADEHLPSASVQLSDETGNFLQYNFAGYARSDHYNGTRHSIVHEQKIKGWQFKNNVNYTRFSSFSDHGFFFRPTLDLSKTFTRLRNYVIGATYASEQNEMHVMKTDSLSKASFAFRSLSAYLRSNQSKSNKWALTYMTRTDKMPLKGIMEQTDRSQNINFTAELRANPRHQFRLNATYRELDIINPLLTSLKPDNTVLGRAEYSINEWKGLVTGNVLYELGAGQEQKRDFSYIEVPAGKGEFAWNDYNGDGIPQLNEFETALFQDQAKYVRVFTPTNQFVKSNYTQFNYSLTFNPRAIGGAIKNKKVKDFITRFNLQSSLQTAKKEVAKGKIVFDPFKGGLKDTSLLTLNNIFANTLSFNRFSQKWGIDIGNTVNFNKALLTYGFESRQLKEWNARARWNFTKEYSLELVQRLGANSLFTPKFANRNYDLETFSTEPKITFTRGTNYRVQTGYEFRKKQNKPEYGGEGSATSSFNIEAKYNAVNNTSILGKFTYSNISYNGAVNSTISYIMLDGLLPGKNFLWNVDVTKRLSNKLELSFQYEGRKPAETRTIHVGRASLRALL